MIADSSTKRGSISFIGLTNFKAGFWVGVTLDEPVGKHNGSVGGEEYFKCGEKCGVFVRPNGVIVGDYPVLDLFDDMDMDEEF